MFAKGRGRVGEGGRVRGKRERGKRARDEGYWRGGGK
jgi:hypothetical protein